MPPAGCLLATTVLLLAPRAGEAALNGAARTPPAGWRSWNFYACEIDAAVFTRQIDALAGLAIGDPLSFDGTPPCTFIRCFNRDKQGVSVK